VDPDLRRQDRRPPPSREKIAAVVVELAQACEHKRPSPEKMEKIKAIAGRLAQQLPPLADDE